MYLLGAHLPDQKLVRIALTSFYGINHATARKLCARLQLHEAATVSSLNDNQVNALSAYLSSPASVPAQKASPTSPIIAEVNSNSSNTTLLHPASTATTPSQYSSALNDSLRSMILESDLKRLVAANINHHRVIGTYRGRRHFQGLPVRGQRTRNNALTARKMNRVTRGFATSARSLVFEDSSDSISRLVEPLRSVFRK